MMDPPLAEAFARRLAAWMDTAAQQSRNAAFYRNVVTQIGEMFGDDAKTADDGVVHEDVLALRVLELVQHCSSRGESMLLPGSSIIHASWYEVREYVNTIRSRTIDELQAVPRGNPLDDAFPWSRLDGNIRSAFNGHFTGRGGRPWTYRAMLQFGRTRSREIDGIGPSSLLRIRALIEEHLGLGIQWDNS